MFLFLVLFLTISSVTLGCDLAANTGIGLMDYSSMEWLNSIISSWYYVNDGQVNILISYTPILDEILFVVCLVLFSTASFRIDIGG